MSKNDHKGENRETRLILKALLPGTPNIAEILLLECNTETLLPK